MAAAVFLTLVLAQAPPAEAGEAAQIERIRKALTEVDAITVAPQTGVEGPVFRVTVRGGNPSRRCGTAGQNVPSNVRPWFRAITTSISSR